jgi:hypothetical protein
VKKPLLDLKNIRVDLIYSGDYMRVQVTHLPSGVCEFAEGHNVSQLDLRLEAIIKIVDNETYREWLSREEG